MIRAAPSFLSYSRTEKNFAEGLASRLTLHGVDVWLDKAGIQSGADWEVQIEQAIRSTNRFIVILSPDASTSPNVRDEVSLALRLGHEIIPILYKPCEILFRLARRQYIDFTDPANDGFPMLLARLQAEPEGQAPKEKRNSNDVDHKPGTKVRSVRAGTLMTGAVLLLLALLWMYTQHLTPGWGKRPSETGTTASAKPDGKAGVGSGSVSGVDATVPASSPHLTPGEIAAGAPAPSGANAESSTARPNGASIIPIASSSQVPDAEHSNTATPPNSPTASEGTDNWRLRPTGDGALAPSIQFVVPFAPGGLTDILARVVAESLGRALGREIKVKNTGGGGGNVGTLEIIKGDPAGNLFGMATVSTTAANPAINSKIGYDPVANLTPIINIAATPNVIAVHPSFPARDYTGFIAELKKNPGKYSYASSGTGGIGHLQTELFKSLAGVFMTHIPYRGAGPALNDTVAGQVPIVFDNMPSALPFIKDGRLIAIVVAAPQRLPQLPTVPTFKEVGLEPVNRMAYYGVVGPKGMSKETVNMMAAAVKKSLEDPGVRKRIEDTGLLIVGNTPEQFAAQIKAELEVYKTVVAKQKLTID